MSTSVLYICLMSLLRISPSLALTLPPNPAISASRTNKTLPQPPSLSLDVPSLAGKYPLGPDLPDPTCNGNLLGFDMNGFSCLQAWNTIPLSEYEVTFGERYRNVFEVKLPRRFSGMDGSCVIDIFHKDGAVSDTSTYEQISSAAEKLYNGCVIGGRQRPQGGWIRDLGKEKNLVVVLSVYEPSVSCFSQKLYTRSADDTLQKLLAVINVSSQRQKFGPEGEPGVEVVLPLKYASPSASAWGGKRLWLTVDVEHHDPVTARWFDIWAGAVAVGAMCVVRGYGGVSALPGGLSVTIDAIQGRGIGE